MNVIVNGKPESVEEGSSLASLVQGLGLSKDGVAVAVNHRVIPRSDRSEYRLRESDQVEVVQAVGGG